MTVRTISLYYVSNEHRKVGHHIMIHVYYMYAPWFQSMSTACMRLGFSGKNGLKICPEVKFSEINLKVNYVDKQNSGRYSITCVYWTPRAGSTFD